MLFGVCFRQAEPLVPRPDGDSGARCVERMNTGQALEHPGDEVRPQHRSRGWQRWLLPAGLAIILTAWQIVTMIDLVPSFLLPSPSAVASRFARGLSDASLARHTLVTLSEVLAGLLLGVLAATVLGYSIAKSAALERLLSPYIVASQAIPIVAIAPLLVIWFGPGRISKVLIAALIVFFPVLVNTVVGVRSVPQDLRELMRSLRASRWQTFSRLEIPAALPVLLGGLKIGATLSVIGAVVGEFVGADEGLGFLVNIGRGLYDTALVFVAVFLLIAMALALYGLVAWFERRVAWRTEAEP
jgi:NitT/TauT family transport system permease protein